MKQSKLEAYRLYFLVTCSWHCVIRFDGNEEKIISELQRIYSDVKVSITGLPKSCPTLKYMQDQIAKNKWVSNIASEVSGT